ncbi:hypothetical protein BDR22DRAFT_884989 [Usnea florida]
MAKRVRPTEGSTPSKASLKPAITYELAVPDLAPLGSFLNTNMVDVFIGAKRKVFRLHEDLLCDRSDYFKATFQGEFIEGKSKELYLPEDNDASFELFVNWLYGGNIKPPSNDDGLQAYFGLLALSEKILIEHLGNLATDHIRTYYRDTKARVSARDLLFVFENTRGHLMQRSLTVVAAMQTLISNTDKGLPPDLRELVMKGGEVAAAFTKYLLYSGQMARIDEMLDPNRSCTFHYHDHTPQCKGPAVRKIDDLEAQKVRSGK